MHNFKIEFYLKIIFFICLISLFSAFFIEYVLGHQPCNLCLIERIPYGLGCFLILLNYFIKENEKFIVLLLILTFCFSLIISIYHFGIEQGLVKESLVCGLKESTDILSKEKLLEKLPVKNISCKDVTFRIFGFSLTAFNIIISLIFIILLTKILSNYEKFEK